VVLLSGCASGSAPEAEEFRQRAETEPARLGDAQVTSIATKFFSTTPTPAPTRTPIVVIADLAIATAVDSSGAPRQRVRSVPASGTMYVTALLRYVTAGSTVVATLGTIDGQSFFSTEYTIPTSADETWVSFQWNLNGSIASGRYAAYVWVDGSLLNSIVFTIG
jgi:hypothetical protein